MDAVRRVNVETDRSTPIATIAPADVSIVGLTSAIRHLDVSLADLSTHADLTLLAQSRSGMRPCRDVDVPLFGGSGTWTAMA